MVSAPQRTYQVTYFCGISSKTLIEFVVTVIVYRGRGMKLNKDAAKTSVDMVEKSVEQSAIPQAKKPRRTILASIAAVGTVASLPSKWTRPIVDHALLPAHAQTSETSTMTATTTITASAQGTVNCDGGRLRTNFYEFTVAPASGTGTTSADMNVTSNDVGFAICTDPQGGTIGITDTNILTFNSSTVSYLISEGIPNTSATSTVSSGSFTSGPITYISTVTATTTV